MSAITDFLENKLLEHSLGKTAYALPGGSYLALFTTASSDSAGGTEVVGTGYNRKPITWGTASGGSISNSLDVTFDVAGSNWGTITHIGIYSAASAGDYLWHGALSTQKTISTNDQFKIATGNLTISLN